MKVKNKKIIVTGGGAGIGRELVLQLIKLGAKEVIALDINEEGLKETKKLVNSDKVTTYTLDITDYPALKKFEKEYFKNHEYIDCLINNAGIIQPFVKVKELEDKTVDLVMDVNFFGPVNLTRLFIDEILERPEGHICNVSSMAGFFPFPSQTIYGASKAALKIFTEGLYGEMLGTNVGVSIVFPGAIATDIVKNSNKVRGEKNEKGSEETKTNMKMTSASEAARQIIEGIEKNKFQVYVGNDAKFMNKFYKFSPKKALKMINDKMKDM
ncbi:MAG: SDR family oxidoreductase [Mollicutes bacterium]|nr:SDR family oxidoreductase [Mollicutes bacterium]